MKVDIRTEAVPQKSQTKQPPALDACNSERKGRKVAKPIEKTIIPEIIKYHINN